MPILRRGVLGSDGRRSRFPDTRTRNTLVTPAAACAIDDDWPLTDTVFIMTSGTLEEVARWFDPDLAPDDV